MSGIGYTIDGNKKDFRTDKEGLAILDHLVVRQPLNLAIDSGTVEDFHLTPSPRGAQVVLRPGRVAEIDLPLIPTIEIDGKIFSKQKGKPEIPAGGINIQLVDTADSDRVVSETKSASDGFYVLPSVPSGKYRIRISQEDLERISPINVEFKVGDLISVTPNSPFIHNINGVLNLR